MNWSTAHCRFFKAALGNHVRTQLSTRVDCTLKHGWAAEKSGDAPIVTRNLGRSGCGSGSRVTVRRCLKTWVEGVTSERWTPIS